MKNVVSTSLSRCVLALLMILLAGPPSRADEAPAARCLIVHADDAGMSHSANRATIQAMEEGSVSSASIMVPCAWFPEIAEYARTHPEKDFGVHLTLTSEWKFYRWGPVAPRDRVPSLVDEQGYLWKNVRQVAEHVKIEEVETELRAQIDRAREFGVPITHLDTHMGSLAGRADLIQLYAKLGLEYDLPILLPRQVDPSVAERAPHLAGEAKKLFSTLEAAGLPIIDYLPSVPAGEDFEVRKVICLHALRLLKPGVTQIIIHCGCDDPELRAITNHYAYRDVDRRVFSDPEIAAAIQKLGIELISWKQLSEINRQTP